MAKKPDQKTLYATRDFTDAGTERSFKKGEPVDVEAGELENYEAAGLVGDRASVSEGGAEGTAA